MDLELADAAKAAVVDIENRLASGEAIAPSIVAALHERYQRAEMWRSEQDTAQRRAEQQAQGIVPGPTQGIGLGS